MTGAGSLRLALLGLVLAAGGCNTYKYFDIDVSFDPTTFDSTQTAQISVCRVTVSGADNGTIDLKDCPSHSQTAPLEVGAFEYSTFASSGTMTFHFQGFSGLGEMPACVIGDGTTSIPVSGLTTITGTLVVKNTGATPCTNTTPVGDGSAM